MCKRNKVIEKKYVYKKNKEIK